jgi:hypothetical protein
MNDIVKTELISIQCEYLELLKKVKSNLDTNWEVMIDEVNLFWFRKKRFIAFYMENYITPYNTYLFTAATFLDYNDKEHFPLVACDGMCIVDDIISTYGNMIGKIDDVKFNKTIKNQFTLCIDDNINILEKCCSYIYILPIRFLFSEDNDAVSAGADGAFLSLFNEHFDNMEDYLQKIISFEDLDRALNPDLKKSILLYNNDNVNLAFKDRIDNYIRDADDDMDFKNKPMSFIFISAVYGSIAQAINVILLCTRFRIIPYLRYNVAFYYFTYFIQNPYISKIENMKEVCLRATACYLIYKNFDKDALADSDFDKFAVIVREKKLYEKILNKIKECGNNLKIKQLAEYTVKELNSIISKFN